MAGLTSPDAMAPRARPRWLSALRDETGVQIAVLMALIAIWWLATNVWRINPFLLPSPDVVLQRIVRLFAAGTMGANMLYTLGRALAGFAAAAVVGIPIGLAMARTRTGRWFFSPLISVGFPAPKLAFLPIFLLWFGIGESAQIVMIAFSCAFIVIAATAASAADVSERLIWSARSLASSERALLWRVVLPAALPRILSGLQVALPISLITAIGTEMYMGGQGLGGALLTAGRFADTPSVYAGIFVAGVLGLVLVKSGELARRLLLPWHQEKSGP